MRAILLLLAIFGSLTITAQSGSLSGKILDPDGAPVPFVSVALRNTTQGTVTDRLGEYKISNIEPGTYQLLASSIGYEDIEQEVVVASGRNTVADFTVSEVSEMLQSVEITGRRSISYKNDASFAATKTATPIKEIPQAISYVTKEVMDAQQAFRVNDVVKNISGINQFSYYNDFAIRGFRSQQELINGLRVIGLFGPQILTNNLERVEIIKGPAAAMFGNSSVGGTMNRVTKKPLAEERKAINFTTGSFNTLRSTLDFTGPLNEEKTLLYRLNVGYENSGSFRDLQRFDNLLIAPSISFLATDRTRLNFDLVLTRFDGLLDRGQPIFGASAGTNLNSTPISFAIGAANDYHETNVGFGTLSLVHEFSDNLSFNSSYMRYTYDEDLFEHRTSNRFAVDAAGNQIPTLMGMRISARIQRQIADNVTNYFIWDTQTGAVEHKLLFGLDFAQQVRPTGGGSIFTSSSAIYRTVDGGLDRYDPETPERFLLQEDGNPLPNIPHFNLENPQYLLGFPSDYILGRSELAGTRFFTTGLYVQDQIKWDRFQFLLGLRQEWYNDVTNFGDPDEENVQQDILLPRLGIVYRLNDAINLYGTYTQSFQPQNPARLVETVGGPFDPEEGTMFEIGAKGTFFRDRLAMNLAVYDIDFENILVTNPETGLFEQRGAQFARGIELDVNGNIGPNLSISANYAYNLAEIAESDDPEEVGLALENAPRHSGGFFANYAVPNGRRLEGLNFNLGMNFVTERNTFERALQLPGYSVWDAGVSYRINRVRLAFNLNNLFDTTHWVGGYSFVRLFPGAPRNYLLSVGYEF
ncbi:MAG: TonB-dependent receptor [Bacteroidota bacterium]